MNVTGSRYKLQWRGGVGGATWRTLNQSDSAALLLAKLLEEARRRPAPLRVIDTSTDVVLAWTGSQPGELQPGGAPEHL